VFENRLLRRILRMKRDEVTGDRRELHNEKLHKVYSSLRINNMIRYDDDEMSRECSTNCV
jgi:hypothetical protein